MPDDRRQEFDLNAFWNGLVRGENGLRPARPPAEAVGERPAVGPERLACGVLDDPPLAAEHRRAA